VLQWSLSTWVVVSDGMRVCSRFVCVHSDATVAPRVAYRAATAEQLVAEGLTFDAVLSLEVIEHVTDPRTFVASLAALVRPGGLLVLSTINRTATSYALGVLAAEHVLRWVPAGTHEVFISMLRAKGSSIQAPTHPPCLDGFRPPATQRWESSRQMGTS
jgi:2-polyprenyl-6-hydroxyphenyl methylase/3-demethylubiquinone-9 3-methyltransferase